MFRGLKEYGILKSLSLPLCSSGPPTYFWPSLQNSYFFCFLLLAAVGFHQCPRGDRACCSFPHRVRHCSPLGEIGEMHGAENLIPSVWPVFLSPKSASQWSILRALSDLSWKHSAGFVEKQSAKECRFPQFPRPSEVSLCPAIRIPAIHWSF